MEFVEHAKDILKILGAVLTLSATPVGVAQGIAITALLVIVAMLWKLLQEFRSWRKEHTALTSEVKRLSTDTDFLVRRHCKIHDKDAFDLLELHAQANANANAKSS